ncbi:Putative ribonuclease H protein At1g65750 [Linum perenne]
MSLFGDRGNQSQIPLISWDRICLPKENRGLGLRLARDVNRAYLTKLAFLFFQNADLLWVRVLQNKYFRYIVNGLRPRNRSRLSALWRGISKECPTMISGARSAIRNGVGMLFWLDCWNDKGERLIDLVDRDVETIDLDASVADLVDITRQWNFEQLNPYLPREGLDLVAGMTPPQQDAGDDEWVWGCEGNRRFTIRSAYNLICKTSQLQTLDVWRWKGPNKIHHFLWLAAHDQLLTNHARKRRNLINDANCHWCPHQEETVLHVLRDCRFAKEVWRLNDRGLHSDSNWQGPIPAWLNSHLPRDGDLKFGITCWFLWRSRNESIFEGASTSANNIAIKSAIWMGEVTRALNREITWLDGIGRSIATWISWEPRPRGWVTLNSDGAVNTDSGKASAGGLIRDNLGMVLNAYTVNLGSCTITRAEIR